MDVQIRFKNETHDFQLPKDATLGLLMNEINSKLQIPQDQQKIICKGKPLKSPTDQLINGMKLLLMATTPAFTSKVTNNPPRSGFNSFYRPQIIDNLKEPYHVLVTNKGLPEGYTPTSQFQQSVFPNSPIIIRNMKGQKATLAFESDALFSTSDDGSIERIFFSNITASKLIEIPTHHGYYALGLMTNTGNKWFYFIPNQITQLINRTLQNR